ncbi:hypothetical protein GCM10010517_12420 [Streptosporangium fragile]|uniref:Uncharacterized protein n=1 Tax=Streptosporangium fragile TaxID=46186 RepID=A0ABN3VRR2_9ACTN
MRRTGWKAEEGDSWPEPGTRLTKRLRCERPVLQGGAKRGGIPRRARPAGPVITGAPGVAVIDTAGRSWFPEECPSGRVARRECPGKRRDIARPGGRGSPRSVRAAGRPGASARKRRNAAPLKGRGVRRTRSYLAADRAAAR